MAANRLNIYDGEGNRVKKITRKQGGNYEMRVYIDGVFEYLTDETEEQNTVHIMDDKSRIATIRIGAAMGDSTPATKYVLENNINSSMVMLDTNGSVVNEQEYYPFGETSFGSYGKKRYQYTGKERDEESGLYYYGARYYSPWTGRFTSVDPKASKLPFWSTYVGFKANPIMYVDPDGQFPILSGLVGFAKGLFASRDNFEKEGTTRLGNAFRSAARHEGNAWKTLGGLFTADRDKSFLGKAWQITSRFTWELPQTAAGYVASSGANLFGYVEGVEYEHGATILRMPGRSGTNTWGAYTLGSFIVGDARIKADASNALFRHEYGHYLQSQTFGPAYIPAFAIPSVISAGTNPGEHENFWTERDADKRAERYFNRKTTNDDAMIHIQLPPITITPHGPDRNVLIPDNIFDEMIYKK